MKKTKQTKLLIELVSAFSFLQSSYLLLLQNVHVDTFVEVAKQSIVDASDYKSSQHTQLRDTFFSIKSIFALLPIGACAGEQIVCLAV